MDFYRATSVYTGAATALLLVLHNKFPDKWKLDREHEFKIWMRTANLPTRSSSIYALALVAQEEGLSVQVVVEEREYDYPDYRFKRYKKIEIDAAKFSSKLYAKEARKKGISIEEREFSLEEVQKHLSQECMVLLRVNAGTFREKKATSKYVLLTAYDKEKDQYTVIDPKAGEIQADNKLMREAFDTLVTKKKRDHRMIILR